MIDGDVLNGAARHARIQGLHRILHDGNPAALLDGPEAACSVVEIPGEDDTNGARPVAIRRRAEQWIDGRPESVFSRSFRDSHRALVDHQVTIRRRDVHAGSAQGHAGHDLEGRKVARSLQNLMQIPAQSVRCAARRRSESQNRVVALRRGSSARRRRLTKCR